MLGEGWEVTDFSARSMRCSISRMLVRYWSSFSLSREVEPAGAAAVLRRGGEFAADAEALVGDEVENRTLLPLAHDQILLALGRGTGAEKAFEEQAWVCFRGERGGGRSPRHVVLVDAGVAAVAVAGGPQRIAGDLKRFERRHVAHALRDDLIDGDATTEIRSLGFLGTHARQKCPSCAAMVAGAIRPGSGAFKVQTAENLQLILDGSHRFHRFVEHKVLLSPSGPPLFGVGAVGELKEGDAQRSARGGNGAGGRGLAHFRGAEPGQE